MKDAPVQCTRCRNKHRESQRVQKPTTVKGLRSSTLQVTDSCCPRCGGKAFYDLTPQVAWCWATGLIEFGDQAPEGAIEIATGPKCDLQAVINVKARHGIGPRRHLLVPGVPEAEDGRAAGDALAAWLKWCARTCRRTSVQFATERSAA